MIISCDDGCASDLRLAELCDKYEIECVFYWPVEWRSLAYDKGYEPLNLAQALSIANRYEVGSHTITHRHLTAISPAEALRETLESKFLLEKLFGRLVTKFAPPRGYTNEFLTAYALENYSYQRLTKGDGLVHIHPDSGANDNQSWMSRINESTKELWCHSWELDKYDLWDELEAFLGARSHV